MWYVFGRNLLCSPRLHYNFSMLICVIYFCDGKAELSAAITPVIWSFRNHCNMLIWCSRNISSSYQYAACLIFLWILWWTQSSKSWISLKQIFSDIINVCTWIKVLISLKIKSYWPQTLNGKKYSFPLRCFAFACKSIDICLVFPPTAFISITKVLRMNAKFLGETQYFCQQTQKPLKYNFSSCQIFSIIMSL